MHRPHQIDDCGDATNFRSSFFSIGNVGSIAALSLPISDIFGIGQEIEKFNFRIRIKKESHQDDGAIARSREIAARTAPHNASRTSPAGPASWRLFWIFFTFFFSKNLAGKNRSKSETLAQRKVRPRASCSHTGGGWLPRSIQSPPAPPFELLLAFLASTCVATARWQYLQCNGW